MHFETWVNAAKNLPKFLPEKMLGQNIFVL